MSGKEWRGRSFVLKRSQHEKCNPAAPGTSHKWNWDLYTSKESDCPNNGHLTKLPLAPCISGTNSTTCPAPQRGQQGPSGHCCCLEIGNPGSSPVVDRSPASSELRLGASIFTNAIRPVWALRCWREEINIQKTFLQPE